MFLLLKDLPLEIDQSINNIDLALWLSKEYRIAVDPTYIQLRFDNIKSITKRFSITGNYYNIDIGYPIRGAYSEDTEIFFYAKG